MVDYLSHAQMGVNWIMSGHDVIYNMIQHLFSGIVIVFCTKQ